MGTHAHTFAVLAYRESPYLEECLLSLRNQTVGSRIFIATSTPSPFLEKTAEKFGIPIEVNHERRGIASDWTFAYRCCGTKYATLAHQDDIYLPGYVERCLDTADRRRDSLILFTGYSEVHGGNVIDGGRNLAVKKCILSLFYPFGNSADSPLRKRLMLSFGNPIPCPSVMFDREKIGEFGFSDGFSYNLDWEAWSRLAEREGGFTYVKERLMLHRVHGNSELVKGSAGRRRCEEDKALFELFWPKPLASMISKAYVFLSYGPYLKGGTDGAQE